MMPQRDVYKKIKIIKENLFLQGNTGVWSFPPVIPLAKFSTPPKESVLKQIAVQIRSKYAGGSFSFGDFAVTPLDAEISLWGWRLKGALPEVKWRLLDAGATYLFENFMLVLGLAPKAETSQNNVFNHDHLEKSFCFYTAALANMVFAPLPIGEPEYSFFWKIGKPVWLPKGTAGGRHEI
ncbi:MAG: hypothetical protein LBD20_09520 [Spirochaetaceae bacterium]|nr:hypothetical protein [Spirochaetaceae bacterium]